MINKMLYLCVYLKFCMIKKLVNAKTFFSCSSCNNKLTPEPGTLYRHETELNKYDLPNG